MNNLSWYIYIVKCKDESLYTGVTKDIKKRIIVHNSGKGSKSIVKSKRPVELVYMEKYKDRSKASIRESEIKKLSRASKLQLIKMGP